MSEVPSATYHTYRLDLKYIGTGFHGWQSQPSRTGIQDHVEKALATLLRHPVRVIGAARTDSGVHAEHQVAAFRSSVPFDARRWIKSLGGLLPTTIGVTSLREAPEDFNPIYASTGKAYCYRLWMGIQRNPFVAPFVWATHGSLDLAAMREATATLVGTHDYTSFCAVDSGAKTRVRTVREIEIVDEGPMVEIWVIGEGFLKQMVRNIVGTLVEVGLGRTPVARVAQILAARDRRAAGMTAAASGLTLVEIYFDELPTVAAARARRKHGLVFAV